MTKIFSLAKPPARVAQIVHWEDDAQWSALVGRRIRRRGLSFHAVRSSTEFKAYLNRGTEQPHCVILASRAGSEDGLAFCRRLKASPGLQAVPVIVLAGPSAPAEPFLRAGALHVVAKDERTAERLDAVLIAVLAQHERSRGVMEMDELRLDPAQKSVRLGRRVIIRLSPGPFAALQRLLVAAPEAVADPLLYAAFLERHPYDKPDHELAVRATLRNYVSRLRGELGPSIGARIVRLESGYSYRPAGRTRLL